MNKKLVTEYFDPNKGLQAIERGDHAELLRMHKIIQSHNDNKYCMFEGELMKRLREDDFFIDSLEMKKEIHKSFHKLSSEMDIMFPDWSPSVYGYDRLYEEWKAIFICSLVGRQTY